MGLIVPQVINSVVLPVVEIFLSSILPNEVPGRVKSGRKLIMVAPKRLGDGFIILWLALLGAH